MTSLNPPPKQSSLQRQMTLTLSAVIIGLMLLVAIPLVIISVQIQKRETARQQQEIANRVAQTVSTIVQDIQNNQGQLDPARKNDLRSGLIAGQISNGINLAASRALAQLQDKANNHRPLEAIIQANPQIQGLARFSLTGNLQESVWRSPEIKINAQSFTQSDLFDTARQGVNAQGAPFISQHNAPLITVAAPILEEGAVTGVMIAWVDVQPVWQSLTNLPVSKTGYLYIIDQNGQAVITPPQFASATPPAALQTTIQARKTYSGLSGQQVIGRLSPIENTPWQAVIEIPTAEANASLHSLLIILGAILMFGLSLAIYVARLFSEWILQPIHTLHDSALQITRGDLAHRIHLERNDELGVLANAFNQMVSTLQETIEKLRQVSRQLLSAEEAERRRIAHEIHDELGQTLTALKFSLLMATRSSPDDPNLIAAREMASAAQEKARTLSHELRPAMLDDMGLLPTLEWYIDRLEQHANLAVSLDAKLDEDALSPELKTTLYRLIVEALTNIRKHAQASSAEIILVQDPKHISLTITDDGQGFDAAILKQTHSLGIAGMRERVNLLRGEFLLKSQAGHGTGIAVTLPVETGRQGEEERGRKIYANKNSVD